jgi:hypothetical protein
VLLIPLLLLLAVCCLVFCERSPRDPISITVSVGGISISNRTSVCYKVADPRNPYSKWDGGFTLLPHENVNFVLSDDGEVPLTVHIRAASRLGLMSKLRRLAGGLPPPASDGPVQEIRVPSGTARRSRVWIDSPNNCELIYVRHGAAELATSDVLYEGK